MKLLLIRHASRALNSIGNTSLSPYGKQQAARLAELVPQGVLPQPSRLVSSPKKRARETFEPVAMAPQLSLEVVVDPRLDERHQNETGREFEARVREVLEELALAAQTAPRTECVWLCTHLDWLEIAMIFVPGALSEAELAASWTNAGYRVFQIDNGLWTLISSGAVEAR